jgi:phage head maturation protease
MANIAVGSLAFSGYGDAPMKFHSPAGVDLGVPASNPKLSPASSGCDGLVTLANGTFCATRVDGGSPDFFTTYTLDSQLAGIVGGTTGAGPWSIANNYADHFYAYLAPFTGNYSLKKFDAAGALVTSFDLGFNFFPSSGPIGVAPDESAAYYSKRSVASDPVRKCDLAGGFATFATETGFSLFDNGILVLANGDVLVGWKKAGVNGFVKHYDASGALLHTYALSGTNQAPLCLTPGLTNTSFWISFYAAGVVTASGVRVAEIEIGTGAVLNSFDPDDGAGFEYDGPFCVVRVLIGEEEGDPCTAEVDYEDPCLPDMEPWIAIQFVDQSTSPPTSKVYLASPVLAPFDDFAAAGGDSTLEKPIDLDAFDIVGCAAPFNEWGDPTFHHGERSWFVPGCFETAIQRGDSRLLMNHQHDLEIASQADGTFELWQDDAGLQFGANLPINRLGELVFDGIRDGLIRACCVAVHPPHAKLTRGLDTRFTRVGRLHVALLICSKPGMFSTSVHINRAKFERRCWTWISECGPGHRARLGPEPIEFWRP